MGPFNLNGDLYNQFGSIDEDEDDLFSTFGNPFFDE
jgi:hypothetical protein